MRPITVYDVIVTDTHNQASRLGPAFEVALVYASMLHRTQTRKGGHDVPYVSHLLGVASLVLEEGGTETQAIAALLHDAVEDQGGRLRLDEIRERFGESVAAIVDACTDAYEEPKPPWRPRKEAYIARLASEPLDALLVSVADKVHNARAILMDLREHGPNFFDVFTGGRDGTLWYYRTLVTTYRSIDGFNSRLVDELARTVTQIEALAGA
jgi:(p)ppGpp synthase/HD superfamily hydrolase